jgi:integrase
MSVTLRPYRRGGWEVDIRVVSPDGVRQIRERKRAPMSSRSTAMRWAESRERVLFQRLMDPSQPKVTRKEVPTLAGLTHTGVHVLRHTFCSHLSMRGAPVRAIQELAGHQDLSMTQRYMHLSPAALDDAIRLLDQPGAPGVQRAVDQSFGDGVETGGRRVKTINKTGH